MEASALFRSFLRTPAAHRTLLFTPLSRPQSQSRTLALQARHQHARHLSLPTIIRPSFWATMIPKPFKSSSAATTTTTPTTPRKEWNPYTPYIILSLLVGSQAIQILWLKQDTAARLRRQEAHIGILKEVLGRIQSGEQGVDVEGLLGTGDEKREKEWMEVLRDIKGEEGLFKEKKRRREERERAEEKDRRWAEWEAEERKKKLAETWKGMRVESVEGGKFY